MYNYNPFMEINVINGICTHPIIIPCSKLLLRTVGDDTNQCAWTTQGFQMFSTLLKRDDVSTWSNGDHTLLLFVGITS